MLPDETVATFVTPVRFLNKLVVVRFVHRCNMSKQERECVQVVVRCRPFSSREKADGRTNIVAMDADLLQVSLTNSERTDSEAKSFTFDAVYDETSTQRRFYDESCYDLVEGVMEG
jgi:Kinesin motor domain